MHPVYLLLLRNKMINNRIYLYIYLDDVLIYIATIQSDRQPGKYRNNLKLTDVSLINLPTSYISKSKR